MGRAARAKRAGRVTIKLTEAEFHQLVSQARLVEIKILEGREKAMRLATEMVQKEIAADEAKKRQLFDALAAKYRFDPKRTYRFDETTCELIAEN